MNPLITKDLAETVSNKKIDESNVSSKLTCELCGCKENSDRGLKNHLGRMRKDIIKNIDLLEENESKGPFTNYVSDRKGFGKC